MRPLVIHIIKSYPARVFRTGKEGWIVVMNFDGYCLLILTVEQRESNVVWKYDPLVAGCPRVQHGSVQDGIDCVGVAIFRLINSEMVDELGSVSIDDRYG